MKKSLYRIEVPQIDEKSRYESLGLFRMRGVNLAIEKANEDYLHWEDLKYRSWIPGEIRKEQFWSCVKISRQFTARSTPIRDVKNKNFVMNISSYDEFLHLVDKEMAGNFMGVAHFSENDKKEYVSRNMIEESIASSRLEGANTSRAVAKKMLQEGRKPKTGSEQMIVNNYKAMQKIEQQFLTEDLTWDLICELHSIITDQTLPVEKQGKLRETFDENNDELVVNFPNSEKIAYIPPNKEFVETELVRLIDFANNKQSESKIFIHPLIKAIMLHFWVAFLHPFEDGNGRLARILFYWYMLRNGYWAFAYISLSEKIKKSPVQYAMAYIYSEQDDYDLTYFINYNIKKLKQARKEFQDYIHKKVKENRIVISLAQKEHYLNERQIKLLQYFNREMESRVNIVAYQKLYSVKKITAISDLKKLVEASFLTKKRFGRNIYYYPTEKIEKLFKFK